MKIYHQLRAQLNVLLPAWKSEIQHLQIAVVTIWKMASNANKLVISRPVGNNNSFLVMALRFGDG